MRTFPVPARLHPGILPVAAAAGIFLSGCAMAPLQAVGRSSSPCRGTAVLYCEVDFTLEVEQCQCVQRGALQEALRSFRR